MLRLAIFLTALIGTSTFSTGDKYEHLKSENSFLSERQCNFLDSVFLKENDSPKTEKLYSF
jgi:hypothetical protein